MQASIRVRLRYGYRLAILLLPAAAILLLAVTTLVMTTVVTMAFVVTAVAEADLLLLAVLDTIHGLPLELTPGRRVHLHGRVQLAKHPDSGHGMLGQPGGLPLQPARASRLIHRC